MSKILRPLLCGHLRLPQSLNVCLNKGQAAVEFTLVSILLLVILWIPADFGLAFYTAQLAANAAREGARLASATPTLPPDETCTYPCSSANEILQRTAQRISSALLPGATISLEKVTGATCMDAVRVTVSGTYNYFFFRLLRLMGVSAAFTNNRPISRAAVMRWEYQC